MTLCLKVLLFDSVFLCCAHELHHSKIPGGLNASATTAALDLSLEQLFPGDKDAYVDLMLVHFPASWGGEGGAKMRVEEWKAMEAWQKTGKARALGKCVEKLTLLIHMRKRN